MRTAAILTAFDPAVFRGGIETYTLHLAALLKEHNVLADVYHTGMADSSHEFHHDYLGRLYRIGRMVAERRETYDMVIANSFYGLGYFPPSAGAWTIYHLTHKGFAEAIRDTVPEEQYLEWKLLWGDLCESASGYGRGCIAVSDAVQDELDRLYGFPDVPVVPNCIDTVNFRKTDRTAARKQWGISGDSYVGLYVGRWDLLKGCDILEAVMRKRDDISWVVALGTGSPGSVLPRLEGLTVFEQVPHERMHELYSAADFLLFPSRYEGYGFAVTEAMACELPVITSDVGIARTICREEPFRSLLLPAFSGGIADIVAAAAERIEYIREHAGRREEIVKEGRKLVEREFGIAAWKKRMGGVLNLR